MNNPYIIKNRDLRLVNAYHIDEFIRNKRYQEYIYSNNGTMHTRLSDNAKLWAHVATYLMDEHNYKECVQILANPKRYIDIPLQATSLKHVLYEFILPISE